MDALTGSMFLVPSNPLGAFSRGLRFALTILVAHGVPLAWQATPRASVLIGIAVSTLLILLVLVLILTARKLRSRVGPAKAPFECDFEKYEVAVPLKPAFRFAHEPLRGDSNGRFVGRQAELEALALRILFSEGGSFLVTGYRGVGKTSFVNQVIRQLQDMLPWAESIFGETKIVDVQLNLARPLTAAELMHHIIRRLYERLLEKGIYPRLSSSIKEDLERAYKRTSFNMTRTLNDETEKSLGLDEIKIGPSWVGAALKGAMIVKRKRSEGAEYEYLGYDDKAAENDVIQISRQLSGALVQRSGLIDRARRIIGKSSTKRRRLIIVFVFDELDKLEEFTVTRHGKTTTAIDELLSALKNVFTTSGVSFVFVAGKDTQERWLEDLGKGDSVYESVFAYDKYLPCMWSDVNALCDGFVDWDYLPQRPKSSCRNCGLISPREVFDCPNCGEYLTSPTLVAGLPTPCQDCALTDPQAAFCASCGLYVRDPQTARTVFEYFKKYLDYRGRGIPRRIIRGFNEYVLWSNQRPILVFTKQDVRRVRVYSELQDLLALSEQRLFGNLNEEIWGTQRDKRRLGVYYLTDWMLRQGTADFTIKDAVSASKRLSAKIAPAEEIAFNIISDIVAVLLEGDFLMEIEQRLDQVQIGDVNAGQEKRYKLAPRRLIEMRGEGDVFEAESHVLRDVAADTDRIGHYQLLENIGSGGMGTVYRAWDEQAGQVVAVKILSKEFGRDPQALERFKRESLIMNRLRHQNIIKCYETGEDKGRLYIAMEYVDGINLGGILRAVHRLDVSPTVSIALSVAEALRYVHEMGFVRNDIKPGNVMLSISGNVYLMDFGITKQSEPEHDQAVTFAGALVGTPYYMSPEQFLGQTIDERSDIYSLGIVIYEMITGELPFKGATIPETFRAHVEQGPQPPARLVAGLSPRLEALILHCLEKDPARRFQASAELIKELTQISRDLPAADLASLVGSVSENIQSAVEHLRVDTLTTTIARDKPPTLLPPEAVPLLHPPPPVARPLAQVDSGIWTPENVTPQMVNASSQTHSLPHLQVISSDFGAKGSFELAGAKTTIGRVPGNDIVLATPFASRFHAAIELNDGRYYLSDLNTANGTLLNETRHTEPVPLRNGDKIQIGKTILEFRES